MKKRKTKWTRVKKYTTETIIEKFREYWGDRFDYSLVIYEGTDNKVKIICEEHDIFELRPWQHKKGVGCYKCGRIEAAKKIGISNRSNTGEFVAKAKVLFGDLYDYSKTIYVHSHKKVTVICQVHGEFKIQASCHLERQGCPMCNIQCSVRETIWLNDIGLLNDRKHRGVNLNLGKKTLVDGYDPETNTVYEFHGDFWHGNPKTFNKDDIHPMKKKTFGQLYGETLEKEKRIRDAGYHLVVMWESDYFNRGNKREVI